MKKTLLLIASAALLLVGCAKEKLGPDAGSGEMVTANFTAQMQGMPQTKAVTDGEGNKANRCVMEIYYNGVLYTRDVQSIEGMKATFTPRLVSNRTYDVLFWADCGGENLADKYYKTNAEGLGLQAVEMKTTAYAANDDARDAFYITKSVPVGQQVSSETFTLTRPFSQVNIITTDAAVIKNANLYPDGVKMVYTAPTKFNLLTETLSEEKELTVTSAPYEEFDATSLALTLEMDYLFAGIEKSALDIAFEASKTGEATTTHSFTNIPVQRNYRTNIKGALLTTTGDWTATIVPGWNQPDEEVKFVEAGSVAAANEAFANGATSVKITSVGEETNLYLPQTTEEVTIDFANPDKGVTIKYGPASTKAAGEKPAAVNIATNDVTKFTVSGISNIVWLAGNQAALASALNNAVAGQTVALANDITMSENWISVSRGSNTPNFDGRNHAISNMTITTEEDAYVGLFSTIKNHVTLQNVTFKNAKLLIPESVGEHARGGVLVGHMYPSDVINCHVEGATIVGCQKLGGLIGYIEGDAANATVTVKDCSVKDINMSSNRPGNYFEHGVGGFIGHVSLSQANLITLENNTIENITITGNKPMENYTNAFLQLVPHIFIGNVCNSYQGEGASISSHSVVLKNNAISGTNSVLPTCMYSSEYFGWAGNAEERPAWKGGIYIDGEEWTPNYPFKNVTTGKGYATLDAALTALKVSETLEIWQAGEYAMGTLSAPANTTIEAKVEVVSFKYIVPSGDGEKWVAKCDNTTVKNITWKVTTRDYNYFKGIHAENCTFDGMITTHTSGSFTNCNFMNSDGYKYCAQGYGGDFTWTDCTFNCEGKAFYAYNEGSEMCHFTFNNCTFNASLTQGKCKAAIFVKHNCVANNQKYTIAINNCTANYDAYLPDDSDFTGTALWNVEEGNNTGADVKVYVDDVLMYDNAFLGIANKLAFKNFADAVNAGKSFKGLTAFLVNDIDLAGETVTPIGAGDKKFDGIFDGKGKTISNIEINGSSNGTALFGHVWEATIKNLKITNAKVTNTALDYTGILAGNGYANISGCDINGTVEGQEQVGAIIGYLSCGSIMNCKVDATVKGTSRVGVLCAKANVDSQYKIEGNTIKGSATSDDIYAGGVVGQIMCGTGKVWTIKNNSIDATVSTGGSLIGNVRSGNWDAFVAGYQTNVTGNTWTAAGNCKITDGNPEHSVEISK